MRLEQLVDQLSARKGPSRAFSTPFTRIFGPFKTSYHRQANATSNWCDHPWHLATFVLTVSHLPVVSHHVKREALQLLWCLHLRVVFLQERPHELDFLGPSFDLVRRTP